MKDDIVLSYWQDLHSKRGNSKNNNEYHDFQIVCYTGLSGFYNRMVHHFQEKSIKRAIAILCGISGKRILEVGCGTGRWCKLFSRLSGHVSAVDISRDAIEINKRLLPGVNFRQMSLTSLGFADNEFDIIFSITVLQHIPYDGKEKAIKEICRCLRSGGFAVILEQIRPSRIPPLAYEDTITFPYTTKEWQHSFEKNGLALYFTERVIFLPLVTNIYLPLKRVVAKLFRKKSSGAMRLSPDVKAKTISAKADYIITLLLTPLSFIFEYLFIYVLGSGRWRNQEVFGRHQLYVLRKT